MFSPLGRSIISFRKNKSQLPAHLNGPILRYSSKFCTERGFHGRVPSSQRHCQSIKGVKGLNQTVIPCPNYICIVAYALCTNVHTVNTHEQLGCKTRRIKSWTAVPKSVVFHPQLASTLMLHSCRKPFHDFKVHTDAASVIPHDQTVKYYLAYNREGISRYSVLLQIVCTCSQHEPRSAFSADRELVRARACSRTVFLVRRVRRLVSGIPLVAQ